MIFHRYILYQHIILLIPKPKYHIIHTSLFINVETTWIRVQSLIASRPLDAIGVNVDLTDRSALGTRNPSHPSGTLAPFPSTAVSIYLLLGQWRLYARIYLAGYQDLPSRTATRRRARIFLSSRAAGYFSIGTKVDDRSELRFVPRIRTNEQLLPVIFLITRDVPIMILRFFFFFSILCRARMIKVPLLRVDSDLNYKALHCRRSFQFYSRSW